MADKKRPGQQIALVARDVAALVDWGGAFNAHLVQALCQAIRFL
jgi:hypothetical protein